VKEEICLEEYYLQSVLKNKTAKHAYNGIVKDRTFVPCKQLPLYIEGFGGLVVSILATGTRVRGFKPGPKPLDFSGIRKTHSRPSFGGEVKQYVPCPSFAACKNNSGNLQN
jgi:hypothetical protein